MAARWRGGGTQTFNFERNNRRVQCLVACRALEAKHARANKRFNLMSSTTTWCGLTRASSRFTRLWIVLLVLCYSLTAEHAHLCSNVDVRARLEQFKKLENCSVVSGYVQIVLFEKTHEEDFANLSFPKLTEITGVLIIYRVRGLKSLGPLFPNLRVIHGKDLVTDFALVISYAHDLSDIGLKSLIKIGGGGEGEVNISHCPNLCYVDTVDWKAISKNMLYIRERSHTNCPSCPEKCNGYCWSANECQKCRDKTKPHDCDICSNYTDGKDCVKNCPKEKIRIGYTCITPDQCPSNMTIFEYECREECPKYFFKNDKQQCVPCNDNCTKTCNGGVVDSAETLQRLAGCTAINGSLTLSGDAKKYNLTFYLNEVKEIHGILRIYRTMSLENLHFFSKLQMINASTVNETVAISAYNNENLNDLFLENVTRSLNLSTGNVSFHYNPYLCLSKIEHFLKATNLTFLYKEPTLISTLSNGDKATCNIVNMTVNVTKITSTSVSLAWNNLTLPSDEQHHAYFVYYTFHNASKWEIDTCEQIWKTALAAENSSVTIKYLEPYTNYTYYITRLTTKISGRTQTNFSSFRTLQDDPSQPIDLTVSAVNSTSIILSWKPPTEVNGVLLNYHLYVYAETDNLAAYASRDHCSEPKSSSTDYIQEDTELKCDCAGRIFDTMCYAKKIEGIEFKNSCDKYTYNVMQSSITHNSNISKRSEDEDIFNQYSMGSVDKYIYFIVNAPQTNFTVTNLTQYTMYIFYLSACNEPPEKTDYYGPEPNKTYCSAILMSSARTAKDEDADVIPNLDYIQDGQNRYLKWDEPISPNQMILSYRIEYNRTDLHKEHKPGCVTSRDHISNGYMYLLPQLDPGSYSFHVKSTSLAGECKSFKTIVFEIPRAAKSGDSNAAAIWITTVCTGTLIIALAIGLYFYRRYLRKHNLENLLMFRSVNPDYIGCTYEADEWEMDRANIEILKELGKGSFGMVYSGFIKSQNVPCAVKTINDTTDLQVRADFLKEASLMKKSNEAHHVVKLLGVVSKGDPPLVVMELMARGDLKNYLRRSRESSHNITCVEMYKMAAEIADGMMYLSARKFVHRDLATRNCMVSADHTVKIGDFGMARDIYETDYYRKETKGLLPVRWMAPESLADGVFTPDSDVWSYGVVLWEIANLAEQPYQGLANEQVLQFIVGKGVLTRPVECPEFLYEIMSACWKWRPIDRPTFTKIVEKLESHVGQDFRLVSFYHSREGEEYRLNDKERVVHRPALLKIPEPIVDDYVQWNDDEQASLYTSSTRPRNSISFTSHRSKLSSNF